jgi:hypothetical protein
MTRFLLLFFCAVFAFSCKPGIPKDIVQPAEMEKVLFDIHLVDGYVSSIPRADSAKKVSAPLYKGIFKKYGIDSAMHAKSMAYYYSRPDLLSKMYERISNKISKTRDDLIKKQEKQTAAEAAKPAAPQSVK